MNRRGFLTRSGLALGALIVGDEVLEAMDCLTHRKVWAGHTFAHRVPAEEILRSQEMMMADFARRWEGLREIALRPYFTKLKELT